MKTNFKTITKIIMAVLLLLCLVNMPYGFYTLFRFIATAAFAYFAYDYFKGEKEGLGFVFVALAVLFQPFMKIVLGRLVWNFVDVAVALFLIYLVYLEFKNQQSHDAN